NHIVPAATNREYPRQLEGASEQARSSCCATAVNSSLRTRQLGNTTVSGRPFERLLEEGFGLIERLYPEAIFLAASREDVPPGGEVMEAHSGRFQPIRCVRKDVVIEDSERVGHICARLANGFGEFDLAAAIGGEIF